ncbi:MAG TPA: hypothetical protein VGV38_16475 [Pyrinomonadaceae bacterium]|nr:hypothetical protein [Pyrinomonadaceae bacterium]
MTRASFVLLLAALAQTSCVVAGYRSGGGWFVWPGGLGLLLLVVVAFLLLRRRR